MPSLFEKTNINHLTLINRFVRSATWEGLATDPGEVTDALIEKMAVLAEGGVGSTACVFDTRRRSTGCSTPGAPARFRYTETNPIPLPRVLSIRRSEPAR